MCSCMKHVLLCNCSWDNVRHGSSTFDTVHHYISKDWVLYAFCCIEYQALLLSQAFQCACSIYICCSVLSTKQQFCRKLYSQILTHVNKYCNCPKVAVTHKPEHRLICQSWNAKYVETSFCNNGSFGDRLCMLLLLDAWVYRCMHAWTDRWLGDLSKYKQLRYEWTCKRMNERTNQQMNECITMCRYMKDSTVGCCTVTMTPSSLSTLSVSCCKTLTPACPTSSQVWVSKKP